MIYEYNNYTLDEVKCRVMAVMIQVQPC